MKYEELANSLEFEKVGNVYTKEIKGFHVYFKDWQYMIYSFGSFYVPCNKEITKQELKNIEKEAFGNAGALFTLSKQNDTLIMSLADGKKEEKTIQERILAQMVVVCTTLKKDGYEPMSECPICHKEAEYSDFGDNYCPIHPECLEKYIEELQEKVKENEGFSVKYLLSIIYSIVLGAIGLLPALLLCIYKYNYFTGLVALCPILVSLGFFLSKAQSKKWLKITTGIIGFVFVAGFTCFSIPYMATKLDQEIVSYIFSGKWVGFKKILFSIILSFGGFGGAKFISKFRLDYKKELEKFKK